MNGIIFVTIRGSQFHAVYHVLTVNHWQDIVREQLTLLLRNSNLASLSVTLAIPPLPTFTTVSGAVVQLGGRSYLNRFLDIYREISELVAHRSSLEPGMRKRVLDLPRILPNPSTDFEHPAMQLVETLAINSSLPILYFHSKGVSYRPRERCMETWRQHLNKVIAEADYWADEILRRDADAAGPCLLRDENMDVSYFAGNFWIATSEYIRTLSRYKDFLASPPASWPEAGSRYLAELAINRGACMQAIAIDGASMSRDDILSLN